MELSGEVWSDEEEGEDTGNVAADEPGEESGEDAGEESGEETGGGGGRQPHDGLAKATAIKTARTPLELIL